MNINGTVFLSTVCNFTSYNTTELQFTQSVETINRTLRTNQVFGVNILTGTVSVASMLDQQLNLSHAYFKLSRHLEAIFVTKIEFDFLHAVEVGVCNAETIDSGSRGVFHWNETEVNTQTSASCFYGPPDVMVTRICLSPNNLSPAMIEICRTVTTAQFAAIQNVRQIYFQYNFMHSYMYRDIHYYKQNST